MVIRDGVIILVYIDDCIIISKYQKKIGRTLALLRKRYTLTDEGHMEEYLGIQIKHFDDSIRMS